MVLRLVDQGTRLRQPYGSIPTGEIEYFTGNHVGGFLGFGLGCHGENEKV